MSRSTKDVLPDSRAKTTRGRQVIDGVVYVPVYCANCGAPYGGVPEDHTTFSFWLCSKCFEKHGAVANTMVVPDEVFWEKVNQAQIEKYGRLLEPNEIIRQLDDVNSTLSVLAREAPKKGS